MSNCSKTGPTQTPPKQKENHITCHRRAYKTKLKLFQGTIANEHKHTNQSLVANEEANFFNPSTPISANPKCEI